jgi:probable F420-dependent oxidoreductase
LHAEQLGYDSVWGNDHMITQHYVRAEFPTPPRFWEPLITYAYQAAVTTRLRFGTGVLVLPMRRDIVVTAKQIATLDHFSGGRLEIGVGIGAYREEFTALQPETRTKRGAIVDEGVQALRLLFTKRIASFAGQYFQFHDVELFPKPLQTHLPLYISGNHPNNLHRTVLWADGWLPAGLHIEIAPQYIVRLARSREQAITAFQGSQMYKYLTSLRTSTLKEQGTVQHEDINLIGTPAQVVEQALALRDAGVTHLLELYFTANTVEDLCDQMQMFAEEVMPQIRSV